jgi:hypothetical protein
MYDMLNELAKKKGRKKGEKTRREAGGEKQTANNIDEANTCK